MNHIKILPSNLQGNIKVPSSKSLCHRAIISAGLSNKISTIENILFSDDIIATCNGMKDLGVSVHEKKDHVEIKGNNFLHVIKNEIDCLESGSTLRFLIPLVLLTSETVTFKGKGKLKDRPLTPYYKIFEEQNIQYSTTKVLPLTISGMLQASEYKISGDVSSQFISGLMFALPLLEKDSRIIITTDLQSKGYVDLTLDMLRKASIHIENYNYREFYIKGNQCYTPINYRVEGDFSQGAFWLVAGLLGREVVCEDLAINSLQGDKVILDFIAKMGGTLILEEDRIKSMPSKTKGITIDASNCPDLVPILAVLGALSSGITEITNAKRLRIKECDRLKAMATELSKLGADIQETKDGLIIHGKETLNGGKVDSWNDHRIAMALSIASIKCENPVVLSNSATVKKSYPGFFKDFAKLGGKINEWNLG